MTSFSEMCSASLLLEENDGHAKAQGRQQAVSGGTIASRKVLYFPQLFALNRDMQLTHPQSKERSNDQ
jgi:hypothetical protein